MNKLTRNSIFMLFALLICISARSEYDLVIKSGRLMDPEVRLDQPKTNIGIKNGRIAIVTRAPISGKKEINANGQVISPGFIDLVSYDPNPLGIRNKIADGVTTNLALHGGTVDPDSWYSRFSSQKLPVNFGASFFYSKQRNELGISPYEEANSKQIQRLKDIATQALLRGALAISFALEYAPGTSQEEVLSMMKLAQRFDVPVFFHLRHSTMTGPKTNIDAISEVISYAHQTKASVHIEHFSSTGGTFSMRESLALIDRAREQGLDITADIYPYAFWATRLNSARFDDGWKERFKIDFDDLQIAGTKERLSEHRFEELRRTPKVVVAYAIPENDVSTAIKSPYMIIASDGILEPGLNNHPRASGTFARTLAVYVREKRTISLMDALAKMTILPARRLERSSQQFLRKGRLCVGADADIVIFDPQEVKDNATVESPEKISNGISWVIVNGEIVKDPGGFNKDAQPGQALRGDPAIRRIYNYR